MKQHKSPLKDWIALHFDTVRQTVIMTQIKSYQEELQDLHHRRVYYILIAGIVIMLLLSLLDLTVGPKFHWNLFVYRTIATCAGMLLIGVNFFDRKKKYPLPIGFIGYICVALSILAALYHAKAISSPHYVGLIILITIYATLAPLTWTDAVASGFIVVELYVITVLLSHSLSSRENIELFNNLFFMICAIFIVSTQSWAATSARKQEYQLRMQENDMTKEIAFNIDILKDEVEKRSREQEASEKRYRLLFNQIADSVVVADNDGKIIQSNWTFDRQFAGTCSAIGLSLYRIALQRHRDKLQKLFNDLTTGEQPVSAYQLSLIKKDGVVMETEINGNLLRRGQSVTGILLIIRDISTRKEMERKLIESLEVKKKTETAAILALAKLSEFRDVTPGHHLERIREYCKLLAIELALLPDLGEVMTTTYIDDIYHASILHDIGKVSIPDELLQRRDLLQPHEQDLVQRHTIAGGDVIKEMEEASDGVGFLTMARHIAYFHHEQWDGKGYPYGLMGREIPLAARIMAIADTYEEMTISAGDSQNGISHEQCVDFIAHNSGGRFDPMVVKAFLARASAFDTIRRKLTESQNASLMPASRPQPDIA